MNIRDLFNGNVYFGYVVILSTLRNTNVVFCNLRNDTVECHPFQVTISLNIDDCYCHSNARTTARIHITSTCAYLHELASGLSLD